MSTNPNVAVLLEAWEAIDGPLGADAIDRYFSEDYVRHSRGGEYLRDAYRESVRSVRAAFPDMAGTLSEIVADGDRVAYRWTSTGTHKGEYLGVPPTHKQVTATGVTITRFEDRLIVEDWASWDEMGVLHALGIIPLGPR
jgi:steroid delta-isomerase-like uncharacterized protein